MLRIVPRLLYLAVLGHCLPSNDEIDSLPLFGPPPTPHFSGYLDAYKSQDCSCSLFYWLALAEGDWKLKPLVLWLNGGPGASSLVGWLEELGPLLIRTSHDDSRDNDPLLVANPYSWTQFANVFVLESPVAVGFSYCQASSTTSRVNTGRSSKEGNATHTTYNSIHDHSPDTATCQHLTNYPNDTLTTTMALHAVLDLLENKFPEFASHELYLTGESYAGVYIPLLAQAIVRHNHQRHPSTSIPLRGMAVGDPCTDDASQGQSRDPLWYSHQRGLVDESLYAVLQTKCTPPQPFVSLDDDDDVGRSASDFVFMDDPDCRLAYRKFLLSSSNAIAGKWPLRYIDRFHLYGAVTSTTDDATEAYLNRPDVQRALHIKPQHGAVWHKHAVRDKFHYTKEYTACNNNNKDFNAQSLLDLVYRKDLIGSLDHIWIYNGDADPAVSFEGTRIAVERMGQPEVSPYRPWFFEDEAMSWEFRKRVPLNFGVAVPTVNAGVQLGGYTKNYGNGIVFITVHGSGK